MNSSSNKISQFWQELKRRKVLRVITVYAAVAFVILQLIEILAPSLRLPEWTMNFILVVLIVGFIVAIILSWIYDIRPEGGIVKTEAAHNVEEEGVLKSSNSWKIASYISFVVIVGLIVLNVIPRSDRTDLNEILDKSIAVIPFIDDSPEKNNEHIINGIMEDILINLQSIKELRVPGRTSVEQYRNNPKTIPEISKELNVAFILEGSGQRYGNKIRLRIQLVEGATDKHLWADSYDEEINEPEDIFRIQSKIAKSIAAELQAVITPEEKQLIEKTPTPSLTAYHFYQRGREEYIKNNIERAKDLYNKALEYDSTFALAYTGLAMLHRTKYYWETYLTENFLDSMLDLADIALSFDDQLSEAYVLRGDYYRIHNNNAEAIIEYDKAINYNPNDWSAYAGKGELYSHVNLVEAIYNYQKAASLHKGSSLPELYKQISRMYAMADFNEIASDFAKEAFSLTDDSAAYYGLLAELEDSKGNFEMVIEFGEKSVSIDSTSYWINYIVSISYSYLGQYDKYLIYIKKYEQILKIHNNPHPWGTIWVGYAYWINGFTEEAKYYFDTALEFYNEIIELGRFHNQDLHTYYSLAAIHAFLGDIEKAYENLKLMNQRQGMPKWMIKDIKNDPLFNGIRDEPEFQQIVRDVVDKSQAEHERVRKWLEENEML